VCRFNKSTISFVLGISLNHVRFTVEIVADTINRVDKADQLHGGFPLVHFYGRDNKRNVDFSVIDFLVNPAAATGDWLKIGRASKPTKYAST